MEGKEYGTGFLILTSSTKKWPESIRKQQDNIERCTVFQNFSVSDQGRSRVFVCKCSTPERAKEIADKLNSYEKLKKERDEMFSFRNKAVKDLLKVTKERDQMADLLSKAIDLCGDKLLKQQFDLLNKPQ